MIQDDDLLTRITTAIIMQTQYADRAPREPAVEGLILRLVG